MSSGVSNRMRPPERPARAPGPPPIASHILLTLDQATSTRISGWAYAPAEPDRHVRLSLYNGPAHLVSFHAATFREDLRDAGMGNGEHGFSLVIPRHIAERPVLDLRLVDEDSGTELATVSVTGGEERFEALSDALLGNLPHFLSAIEDKTERLRSAQQHLALLMSATVATYGQTRALLEEAAVACHAMEAENPVPPPEAVPFDRIVRSVVGRYPVLSLPRCDNPQVSIVIPVFNNFEYTYNCVKSLLTTQSRATFEVIIVDDQSSDETLLAPMLLAGATVLRNERNQGFVLGCNRGAAAARGEYVFFLNNDTEVHDFALDALLDVFRLHARVGIAGSKLLFGDGTLQDAGGIVWRLGDGWNYGRGQDPGDPRFNYLRDADYLSGAALMIPKALCDEIGGFNPELAPGYYEDTDMAFRARALGYRTVYQPRSVVTHFEGASSGTDVTQGMKQYQLVNARKFLAIWKQELLGHALSGQEPDREKDRKARFRVLFVDATTPTPREDAGSNAALSHMRALQALGAKVTFVPSDNMAHLGQVSADLQDLGIEFLHHPYFWSVEEALRKRAHEFDVIYLHRYDVAFRYMATCRAFAPRARILYNVADLHFLRLERERKVGAASARTEAEVAMVRNQELGCIRLAHRVIVHSEVEAAILAREGVSHVSVIPWVMEGRPGPLPPERRGRTVGFLGGFGHPPNADAVAWFVEEIWPLVRAEVPDAEFLIFGSRMPAEIQALSSLPGVTPVGFVPEVADAFARMRVSVAPLRYGAGLKGKVGESLAHGVPCIGTSVAFEGFGQNFREACVADDAKGMAAKLVRLLTHNGALAGIAARSKAYAVEHLSANAVQSLIAAAIS